MSNEKINKETREIAAAITNQVAIGCWRFQSEGWLIEFIDKALHDRDERAAKIAEAMRPSGGRMWADEQTACFEALSECATAIRNGVADAK